MKRIAWPILLTLFVSPCQSEAGDISALPSPEQPPPVNTKLIQSPPSVTSNRLNPSLILSRTLETPRPIETGTLTAEPAAKKEEEVLPRASLTAIDEGVLPTGEPTMTPMVTINGLYEGTYFRGLESAPVTMIDYSDFL